MRACEHNRQLRMTVNDERRYRMIQLGACTALGQRWCDEADGMSRCAEVQRRIQADLKEVADRNEGLRSGMSSTNRELQRVEGQIEGHKAWFREQEQEQEQRWRELDQDPADVNLNVLTETRGTTLPKVGRGSGRGTARGGAFGGEEEADRVGNMTIGQETKVRQQRHRCRVA